MPPSRSPLELTSQDRRDRRTRAHLRVVRQRRIAAVLALLIVAAAIAFAATRGGSSSSPSHHSKLDAVVTKAGAHARAKPKPPPQLPGGGRRLFPRHRIVAFYGTPNAPGLGALGVGTAEQAAQRLLVQTRAYRRGGRKLLPAMELIAVVAARSPQKDGSYTHVLGLPTVKRYLLAARKIHALLVLDIQPGHAQFMPLVKHFGRFLREPDVGLALDPEWATPGAVPGTVIGSTDAATVNRVSAYLARVVRTYRLPDKLLLVHQFTESMIRDKGRLRRRRGIALVLNVDGFGGQAVKIAKYNEFTRPYRRFHSGFKLFYKEDTGLLTPEQVLQMRPRPDVIDYE